MFYPPLDLKIKARIIELISQQNIGRVKIQHQLKKENIKVSDASISNVIRDYKLGKSKEAPVTTEVKPTDVVPATTIQETVKPTAVIPEPELEVTKKLQQDQDKIKLQILLNQRQLQLEQRQREVDTKYQQLDKRSEQLDQRQEEIRQSIESLGRREDQVKAREIEADQIASQQNETKKHLDKQQSLLNVNSKDMAQRERYVQRYEPLAKAMAEAGLDMDDLISFFEMIKVRASISGLDNNLAFMAVIKEYSNEDQVNMRLYLKKMELGELNDKILAINRNLMMAMAVNY